jgi:hypothetical protein
MPVTTSVPLISRRLLSVAGSGSICDAVLFYAGTIWCAADSSFLT